jgi:inhibitor of the pro-sigma K processing machinery
MNEWWAVLLIVSGVGLVFVLSKSSTNPLKWVWIGMINIIIGALGLYFFNLFGQIIDLGIPINLITAAVVGVLGVPGLIALVLVKFFIL